MSTRAGSGLAIVLMLVACADYPQEEVPVTTSDYGSFAASVQPYVGAGCGTLDCHGEWGRPLRLYSEHGLRFRDDLRGRPIADEEVERNLYAVAAVSPGTNAAEHPVLLKPLAVSAGGMHHVGGDLWASPDDPGYVCLREWLDGRGGDPAAVEACSEARTRVTAW